MAPPACSLYETTIWIKEFVFRASEAGSLRLVIHFIPLIEGVIIDLAVNCTVRYISEDSSSIEKKGKKGGKKERNTE